MARVRFAPSPTGYLHVGGLRTALYDELLARKTSGSLILRIEDTDQTRFVEGAVENILRTLDWAGIRPDEGPYLDDDGKVQERGDYGPYVQSKRLETYLDYANKLLESGHAYRCFCTAERLEEMRNAQQAAGRPMMYDRWCLEHLSPEESEGLVKKGKPFVIRLKVPKTGNIEFDDAVRGKVSFQSELIDDQVLMKSDGFPTYHLAVVVDDHLMKITHVIRGEEWLPSTPKHILLYKAFGWELPIFAHLPLLLNPDRSKLSKRQGDVAVEDYRNQGYLPEALVNFIALLGWNPSAEREIYSKDELYSAFDLGKINKGGAVFNREKLDWLNREYMKKIGDDELAALFRPFFEKAEIKDSNKITDSLLTKIVHVQRGRANRLSDLTEGTDFLLRDEFELDVSVLPWKKSTADIASDRLSGLEKHLSGLNEEIFDDLVKLESATINFVSEQGWTNAESLWPMRVALTGQKASPSPFEVAWVIGKERTLDRIRKAINLLKT